MDSTACLHHCRITASPPLTRIKLKLMTPCLLVHDELFIIFFFLFWLLILLFLALFSAVGCSLICRLDSIEPNLWLIINCVIKVCVGVCVCVCGLQGGLGSLCIIYNFDYFWKLAFQNKIKLWLKSEIIVWYDDTWRMEGETLVSLSLAQFSFGCKSELFILLSFFLYYFLTHCRCTWGIWPTWISGLMLFPIFQHLRFINYSKCQDSTLNFTIFKLL